MRDRNGNTTLYEYDNRNLLVMKRVVETGASISYAYDPSGNRKSMIDESGTYRYEYNGRCFWQV
jgi:YD repeat-containing protein